MTEADTEVLECARYGEPEDLRILLQNGANVNHRDSAGNTALHRAAANGEVECLRILQEFNAEYSTNNSGNTPLHWAAMNQQLEAVQYLLDTYPQDVLATNASGRSALTEAFSTSNMNVVNILLQHSSASEERFHETTPPSEGAGDDSEESKGNNTELSEGINTENAIEHEFLLSQDKTMRIRELPIVRADNPFGSTAEEDTTGMGIWAAAVLLARWCAEHVELFQDQVVVELGAGCGVPGIAAAVYAQARKVYLTDVNPLTMENLSYNASMNAEAAVSPEAMEVLKIDWSNRETWPEQPAHVIIGADLVYSRDILPLLCSAVAGLLAPGGHFYYIAPETGRDGLEDLPAAMESHGVQVVQITPIQDQLFENPLASADPQAYMLHFMDLVGRTPHNLHIYQKRE